ncbi:D-arabinose 1-dehydrogenase-like Zn-dependent alcohol dehydrogenase [Streptomyces sp. Ag109_O5-1]|uniref:zinc-binding dehydrogenase n=1 Tax=Streptomyces sp. Ag109_O5-1 TaxID=1938851 RepID=UPI000F4EFD0A|nr:zinc-binding dehydrogenase [Streptomyces sp. Ag109_O5-1]RPE37582.1 D-arabinose 1-dehydrogenase-like Zn-dependent alcohol dehydrogenase [Streptomyces sp. Ag109_O5-1]
MDTMLAGRVHLDTKKFLVEEIPVPEPGPGEVLIEVKAAGVCLSDLHLIDGSISPVHLKSDVLTLGHEISGDVHALGPGLKRGLAVGTRVALQAGQPCRECATCVRGGRCTSFRGRGVDYDGGWSQYTVAREDTVVPIPDALPFDQAAIIPDAVSTSYAALVETVQVRSAQSVGIWGVGGVGAHAVRLARMMGASPIIAVDPLPGARERALAFGADIALDPTDPGFAEAVLRATDGMGLDHAFDFAGVPRVREQASPLLGDHGALVLVGITMEPLTISEKMTFNLKNKKVYGHYGSSFEHVYELIRLAGSGRLDLAPSITGHIPLAEASEAIHRLEHKIGDPIRLILVP